MHNHTSDSTCHGTSYSGLTFSFLAGSLAGATVALLLAPQSGKDTREMMGRKLNDTADSALAMKGRLVERLNDTADSALAMKGR
ncbi:MAG: YtxH domain-containing protein, partial [Vicinamibacteria bacterium]|nr:YtxH domain-containing protein [Vicinamibacteria bacterium]